MTVLEIKKTKGHLSNKTKATLKTLLETDLDFHNEVSSATSHDFHAFPAKFPPQLPRLFIEKLTKPGETVLDPMMGSGTSILEAARAKRQALTLIHLQSS